MMLILTLLIIKAPTYPATGRDRQGFGWRCAGTFESRILNLGFPTDGSGQVVFAESVELLRVVF